MHKFRLERQLALAEPHLPSQAGWDAAADEVDARDLLFTDFHLKVMQGLVIIAPD